MHNLHRNFWFVPILLFTTGLLACGVTGIAPGYIGGMRQKQALVSPYSPGWSHAEIAKPTYTPTPTPIFTATPVSPATAVNPSTATPSPTEAPPLLIMTIVDDASSPVTGSQSNVSDVPTGNQSAAGSKYILVSISEQHLYAYQDGQLIKSFVASTGMGNSTRVGNFSVLDKIPNAYGATWNIWMPNWLGIYESGSLENGIHALPILPGGARLWSGYLGTPISYGCVVLGVDEAFWLYNWAEVGTPVEIRW